MSLIKSITNGRHEGFHGVGAGNGNVFGSAARWASSGFGNKRRRCRIGTRCGGASIGMQKRGGSLDEVQASGLGEELIFLVDLDMGG